MNVTLVPTSTWRGSPAVEVFVDGTRVDLVYRRRHTVRTPYKGTRIGYDRSHWCWEVESEVRSCHPSRKAAVATAVFLFERRS